MRRNRTIKPGPDIPKNGDINGYAMIVDLNQFASMVSKAEETGDAIAQFTRDALSGAIFEIEAEGGEVVAFMGDAVLGFFPEGESVVLACFGIAKDLDRQCEYISNAQEGNDYTWPFAPGGPSLKISVEYGMMDVSTIDSRLLGEHRLLIGSPINYAARISKAGEGNRCIIGPAAAKKAFSPYTLDGPHNIAGKPSEPDYEYYLFGLGDIWIDGPRETREGNVLGLRYMFNAYHLISRLPLAEQTWIVAEVERQLSVVDELESVVTANLQRATRLRQSILQKAFTGDL